MKRLRLPALAAAILLLSTLFGAAPARAEGDPAEQQLHARAVEAVIWSMPAISTKEFTEATFKDYGVTWNDVVLFSKPALPRHELLTANNQVPYMIMSMNVKNGPVVVELPPASKKAVLMGSFCDNWFASLIDGGPAGADQGRGGKYLFLPPGYKGSTPAGYIVVKPQGFLVTGCFRPVAMHGGTNDDAHKYAMQVKVYPLSAAAHPPATRFVDGFPKPLHSLPVYKDDVWFAELADFVNKEPIRERDKVMMGMLGSLGIEKGKPFKPTPAQKKAMTGAVEEARQLMQTYFVTRGLAPWWPKSGWTGPNPQVWAKGGDGWSFDTPNGLWYDCRAGGVFYWATYIPKKLGGGSFYLMGVRDADGQPLRGDSTYKLHVPKDVPVSQFWSAILYCMDTKAFAFTPSNRVGLSSFDKPKMKTNSDGSVDLYFGPQAPAGLESNWVPTGGKDFFLIFRLYGPQKPLYTRKWKLPELVRQP